MGNRRLLGMVVFGMRTQENGELEFNSPYKNSKNMILLREYKYICNYLNFLKFCN